jgi:hypothetical protein
MPKRIASKYFVEIYAEDRKATPLSPFARDQREKYYDHDFLEYDWGTAATIQELVRNYSYSEQWADELAKRVAAAGLTKINFFVFISQDEIKKPRSVEGDGYWLRYMGTIEYQI